MMGIGRQERKRGKLTLTQHKDEYDNFIMETSLNSNPEKISFYNEYPALS